MSFVLKADPTHSQKQTVSEVLVCGIALFEQLTVTIMQRQRQYGRFPASFGCSSATGLAQSPAAPLSPISTLRASDTNAST